MKKIFALVVILTFVICTLSIKATDKKKSEIEKEYNAKIEEIKAKYKKLETEITKTAELGYGGKPVATYEKNSKAVLETETSEQTQNYIWIGSKLIATFPATFP
jgi:hypothetical protein